MNLLILQAIILYCCTSPVLFMIIFFCFNRVLPNNIHVREPICAWDKASSVIIYQYRHALECHLSAIDIDMGVFRCSNNKFQSIEHKHSIDRVCLWIINCCIEAGL